MIFNTKSPVLWFDVRSNVGTPTSCLWLTHCHITLTCNFHNEQSLRHRTRGKTYHNASLYPEELKWKKTYSFPKQGRGYEGNISELDVAWSISPLVPSQPLLGA